MMEIVTIEISVPTVAPPSNTEGSNMRFFNKFLYVNKYIVNQFRVNE